MEEEKDRQEKEGELTGQLVEQGIKSKHQEIFIQNFWIPNPQRTDSNVLPGSRIQKKESKLKTSNTFW